MSVEWTRQCAPDRLATAVFGLICGVGLVGAFVGLSASSFTADEIFTAWVIGTDGDVGGVLRRALTDVHPPLYYFSAFFFSRMTGLDELGMRLLSALCATGALLTFILGTRRSFSLAARLFAAASATGSYFWFYHAQNVRSYALTMLIGAGIVAVSVDLISRSTGERKLRHSVIAGLFGLCVLEAAVHFYGLLVGIATLLALSAAIPARRLVFLALAAALVILGGAYIEFVERRFVSPDVNSSWIGSSPAWYRDQLIGAAIQGLGRGTKFIIGVCLLTGCVAFWTNRRAPLQNRHALAALLITGSVPVLVFVGGFLSSLLFQPSLTDRNVLVSVPFVWGGFAALYDLAVGPAPSSAKYAANGLIAICLLLGASMVTTRGLAMNEPFGESASWIEKAFPECRNQKLLAIAAVKHGPPAQEPALWGGHLYSSFLRGFASAKVEYLSDVAADGETVALLRDRSRPGACPEIGRAHV